MTAEFRIVATELDDDTADLADYQHAHTFGLWVDDRPVLHSQGVWNGQWSVGPMAAAIRSALLNRMMVVRHVAADPETVVVDLCRD